MFQKNELDEFYQIRQDIHAHPELKYQEFRTSKLIENYLKNLKFDEVFTGIGGTGLVGVLKGTHESKNKSIRSIGLRADMDALPIQEENSFSHKSVNSGKMHACGHDGHVTILLAAAKKLSESRNFCGRVNFIFQPAEEGGAGGKAMIEDGLFENFPMDEIYALHNWPGMSAGSFGFKSGPIMASSNQFEINIHGKGGHAAMPHLCVDPVLISSHLIQSFQTIASRFLDPIEPVVVSVTKIEVGETANIISDKCNLLGTVRTFSMNVLDLVETKMKHMCETVAKTFGGNVVFNFQRQYPPTINHPKQTEIAISVAEKLVGKEKIDKEVKPSMGAEDFSFMLQKCPGSYFFLGNGISSANRFERENNNSHPPCMLHNSKYDFNDSLIGVGAEFWVRLIESRIGEITDD
tara:strand:+ start:262 stop:1482 length:1221 start_codon:yes stop_codon:yes gene_type:complete